MREVKDPEVRKAEIIQAAKVLFATKGYLKTTTQDIIDAVKMSRGLLYYHFKSKQDILYYIVESHTRPLLLTLKEIAYDYDLDAEEKVRQFVHATLISEDSNQGEQIESQAIQAAVILPENTFMMDQINHKLAAEMTEYMTRIIVEGNETNSFDVAYPREVATFLMTAFPFVANSKELAIMDVEVIKQYLLGFEELLNKVLEKKIF